MNTHELYYDLLSLLCDHGGYPPTKLDGPVPKYEEPGNDATHDPEQVSECCQYLLGVMEGHLDTLRSYCSRTEKYPGTGLFEKGPLAAWDRRKV